MRNSGQTGLVATVWYWAVATVSGDIWRASPVPQTTRRSALTFQDPPLHCALLTEQNGPAPNYLLRKSGNGARKGTQWAATIICFRAAVS
jgi:hypothetical protein